jgi:hypothetical protein
VASRPLGRGSTKISSDRSTSIAEVSEALSWPEVEPQGLNSLESEGLNSGPSAAPVPGQEPQVERPRLNIAELHCDCPTPWDPDPPVLLVAATKDGPVQVARQLATKPGQDVRAAADQVLAELGTRTVKPWKDTRHTLLPPADPMSRVKTRPGWATGLADGRHAVVDVPPDKSAGVHCGDCHRNFANAGAHQVHKARWDAPCRDPAAILAITQVVVEPPGTDSWGRQRLSRIVRVDHGVHLMDRMVGGVWTVNKKAPWGPSGPPMDDTRAMEFWRAAQDKLKANQPWQFGRGHNP